MKYYSTNGKAPLASLADAVGRGLAPDGGLYMPEHLPRMPKAFFNHIGSMSLQEMAFAVAYTLFGSDVDSDSLKRIVSETLNFPIPLEHVEDRHYSLELFHGPTLAFKDVGARFLARLMAHVHAKHNAEVLNVLVATSGDSGGAVANGFYGVPGVRVFVLYPAHKLSAMQEAQFATLGDNIYALEVDGTFDDCQTLVKNVLMSDELNRSMPFTCANSINVGRLLPQMFYYFHAYAQLQRMGEDLGNVVMAVPSGNLGNLTAALMAKKIGLPVKRFIAANNCNDVTCSYLQTGVFQPKTAVDTLASAMDVGNPSNFHRIISLYGGDWNRVCADVEGVAYADSEIAATMLRVYRDCGYLLDPHGAVAYRAIDDSLHPGEVGVMLETAHPSKFAQAVSAVVGEEISIPGRMSSFLGGNRRSVSLPASFGLLKHYLLTNFSK